LSVFSERHGKSGRDTNPNPSIDDLPDESSPSILSVRNLTAGYHGQTVVRNIDLCVAIDEIVGFVGRNGSGKSMVLLALAGLIWGKAESIVLDGQNLCSMPAWLRARRGLGLLLQRVPIFPELSVSQNLDLAVVSREAAENVFSPGGNTAVISKILDRGNTPAGALSGGERRILGLAMAIARRPKVLLADEPTLGLALETEDLVFALLTHNLGRMYSSLILVSHCLDSVERYCSRAYLISEGLIRMEYIPAEQDQHLSEVVRSI